MQYPKMLYKDGNIDAESVVVQDETEHSAKREEGFFRIGEMAEKSGGADGKAGIMARLDELGVKYDGRAGEEKLRAILNQAEKSGGED